MVYKIKNLLLLLLLFYSISVSCLTAQSQAAALSQLARSLFRRCSCGGLTHRHIYIDIKIYIDIYTPAGVRHYF